MRHRDYLGGVIQGVAAALLGSDPVVVSDKVIRYDSRVGHMIPERTVRGSGCGSDRYLDRAGQDAAQRGGELAPGIVGGGLRSPGDEAIRSHENRSVAGDLAPAQPAAARVVQVAVEVPDPHRVEREPALLGELLCGLAPAWPSSPAMSRKRPGATRSLIARRLPFSSSIQACGSGAPGRVDGS